MQESLGSLSEVAAISAHLAPMCLPQLALPSLCAGSLCLLRDPLHSKSQLRRQHPCETSPLPALGNWAASMPLYSS